MGYWNAGKDGSSLHAKETGLVWGDEPADAFDSALQKITRAFKRDMDRSPTKDEIRSGLEFALKSIE